MSSFTNSSINDGDTSGDLRSPNHRADIPPASGEKDIGAEHFSGDGGTAAQFFASSSNPSQHVLSSSKSSEESNRRDTRATSAFVVGSNSSLNAPSCSESSSHASLAVTSTQSVPRGTNPRGFSKKKKELFSKIQQFHSATGKSAAAIFIDPSGDMCAYGAPSVESAIDGYLDAPSTGGAATNMKHIKQLLETPIDGNENLEELLKLKQQLEDAREFIRTQRQEMD